MGVSVFPAVGGARLGLFRFAGDQSSDAAARDAVKIPYRLFLLSSCKSVGCVSTDAYPIQHLNQYRFVERGVGPSSESYPLCDS